MIFFVIIKIYLDISGWMERVQMHIHWTRPIMPMYISQVVCVLWKYLTAAQVGKNKSLYNIIALWYVLWYFEPKSWYLFHVLAFCCHNSVKVHYFDEIFHEINNNELFRWNNLVWSLMIQEYFIKVFKVKIGEVNVLVMCIYYYITIIRLLKNITSAVREPAASLHNGGIIKGPLKPP